MRSANALAESAADLARLNRAGELVAVRIPSVADKLVGFLWAVMREIEPATQHAA